MALYICEFKVIANPELLLLLGVDLLCSGHPGWDFRGIRPGINGCGFMTNLYGCQNKTIPLLGAPHLANLGQPVSQLLLPPPPAAQDEAGHSHTYSLHQGPKKPAPEPAPPQCAAYPTHHVFQDPLPALDDCTVDARLQ